MGFFDNDNMSWADFDGSGDVDSAENYLGLEILEGDGNDRDDMDLDYDSDDLDYDSDYVDDPDDMDLDDYNEIESDDFGNDRISLGLEISVSLDPDDDEYEKNAAEARELMASENCPTAMKYYSLSEEEFLFAKAIKENFDVPCALPDETDRSKVTPAKILKKIAKNDVELAVAVWEWCVKEFMPYKKFAPYAEDLLSYDILDNIYGCYYTDDFLYCVVRHMTNSPDFCRTVMQNGEYYDFGAAYLIGAALHENIYETADAIFGIYLERAKDDYRLLKEMIDRVLYWCEYNKDTQSVEYFRNHMLPLVKEANQEVFECEVDEWEESISEHMAEMDDEGQTFNSLEELQEHISEKAKQGDVKEFKWVGPCEFEMVVSAEDEDDLERKLKEMFGDAIEREK